MRKVEMVKPQAQSDPRLAEEKLLFRYSRALEQGDFETVAQVLGLAEQNPGLERMLLELNQAYLDEEAQEQVEPEGIISGRDDRAGAWNQEPVRASGADRDQQVGLYGAWQRGRSTLSRLAAWFRSGGRQRRFAGYALALLVVGLVAFSLLGRWSMAVFSPSTPQLVQTVVVEKGGGAVVPGGYPPPIELPAMGEAPTQAPAAEPDRAFTYATQPAGSRSAAPYSAPGAGATGAEGAEVERLIVHNGSISIVVTDTRKTRDRVQGMLNEMAAEGAYVVSSSESSGGSGEMPAIHMALRVPAKRFGETMNRIAALGQRVMARSETAQDVTEEYVDLEGRLKGMETSRKRLLEILQEAQKADDLLQIENLLAQREAEIEALKGRMQYLSGAARLASIELDLQPSILSQPIPPASWSPAETARRAVDEALQSLQRLADTLITISITILPWLLAGGLLVYGLARRVLKRGEDLLS